MSHKRSPNSFQARQGAGSSLHQDAGCGGVGVGKMGLSPAKGLAITSKALTFCLLARSTQGRDKKKKGRQAGRPV